MDAAPSGGAAQLASNEYTAEHLRQHWALIERLGKAAHIALTALRSAVALAPMDEVAVNVGREGKQRVMASMQLATIRAQAESAQRQSDAFMAAILNHCTFIEKKFGRFEDVCVEGGLSEGDAQVSVRKEQGEGVGEGVGGTGESIWKNANRDVHEMYEEDELDAGRLVRVNVGPEKGKETGEDQDTGSGTRDVQVIRSASSSPADSNFGLVMGNKVGYGSTTSETQTANEELKVQEYMEKGVLEDDGTGSMDERSGDEIVVKVRSSEETYTGSPVGFWGSLKGTPPEGRSPQGGSPQGVRRGKKEEFLVGSKGGGLVSKGAPISRGRGMGWLAEAPPLGKALEVTGVLEELRQEKFVQGLDMRRLQPGDVGKAQELVRKRSMKEKKEDTPSTEKWQCHVCTLENVESAQKCAACYTARLLNKPEGGTTGLPVAGVGGAEWREAEVEETTWGCRICTLVNKVNVAKCSACGNYRGANPSDVGFITTAPIAATNVPTKVVAEMSLADANAKRISSLKELAISKLQKANDLAEKQRERMGLEGGNAEKYGRWQSPNAEDERLSQISRQSDDAMSEGWSETEASREFFHQLSQLRLKEGDGNIHPTTQMVNADSMAPPNILLDSGSPSAGVRLGSVSELTMASSRLDAQPITLSANVALSSGLSPMGTLDDNRPSSEGNSRQNNMELNTGSPRAIRVSGPNRYNRSVSASTVLAPSFLPRPPPPNALPEQRNVSDIVPSIRGSNDPSISSAVTPPTTPPITPPATPKVTPPSPPLHKLSPRITHARSRENFSNRMESGVGSPSPFSNAFLNSSMMQSSYSAPFPPPVAAPAPSFSRSQSSRERPSKLSPEDGDLFAIISNQFNEVQRRSRGNVLVPGALSSSNSLFVMKKDLP